MVLCHGICMGVIVRNAWKLTGRSPVSGARERKEMMLVNYPVPLQVSGFTGTRERLSSFQRTHLVKFLTLADPSALRHGDCVGADYEAHLLCLTMGIFVHVHPPVRELYRAFARITWGGVVYDPKPYRDRNIDIVDGSAYLIAFPKEEHEVLRSGTWQTVRYARSQKKDVFIFFPDGWVDMP